MEVQGSCIVMLELNMFDLLIRLGSLPSNYCFQ